MRCGVDAVQFIRSTYPEHHNEHAAHKHRAEPQVVQVQGRLEDTFSVVADQVRYATHVAWVGQVQAEALFVNQ